MPLGTLFNILLLGPSLSCTIGATDAGGGAEDQAYHQAPGPRCKDVGVCDPAQPSTNDQGCKQFRTDSNGLPEARVQRIARGHNL